MKNDNLFKYIMMDFAMIGRTKSINRQSTSWMTYIYFANIINAWKKKRVEKKLKQEWHAFLNKEDK